MNRDLVCLQNNSKQNEQTEFVWWGTTFSTSCSAVLLRHVKRDPCDMKIDSCDVKRDPYQINWYSIYVKKSPPEKGKKKSTKRRFIFIGKVTRCTFLLERDMFIEKIHIYWKETGYYMYLVLFNKYGQWSLVEQETRQSPIERVLLLHSGGIWSANCTQHE